MAKRNANTKPSPKILVVDDERAIRDTLSEILQDEGYSVLTADSALAALKLLEEQQPDAMLSDIKMPGMDGIDLLAKALAIRDIPVIMVSGHGTIEVAVDALKRGAFDYIEKPIDLNRLLAAVRNALERSEQHNDPKDPKATMKLKTPIIGQSKPLKEVMEMVRRVAPTQARVLITGENGTGKELVARAIHELSGLNGPFVEVNCAAIPDDLIESELFGHEKGAFTSAIKQRQGKFELANGGTLFLDEIGDMHLPAQAKVLRALQENRITRVGGESDIPVHVRVIAATNKDLQAEIAAGNFREDLYHRLGVIPIRVPSLRERTDDIPLLIQHFLNTLSAELSIEGRSLTPKAIKALQALEWRGNIRELRNVIERLMILVDGQIDEPDIKRYATSE